MPTTAGQTSEAPYSRVAERYDQYHSTRLDLAENRTIERLIRSGCRAYPLPVAFSRGDGSSARSVVLDLGCGTGEAFRLLLNSRVLASRVEYYGVDSCEAMLSRLVDNLPGFYDATGIRVDWGTILADLNLDLSRIPEFPWTTIMATWCLNYIERDRIFDSFACVRRNCMRGARVFACVYEDGYHKLSDYICSSVGGPPVVSNSSQIINSIQRAGFLAIDRVPMTGAASRLFRGLAYRATSVLDRTIAIDSAKRYKYTDFRFSFVEFVAP
jgi:SAM-dependent methyltransferase